jgi:hypothetical protein
MEIVMPKLGLTMTEDTLTEWRKLGRSMIRQVGQVKAGLTCFSPLTVDSCVY